jgi:hypothetical protein
MKILRWRGRPGKPRRPVPASGLYPYAREGGAVSNRPANKETEGLLPLLTGRCAHGRRKSPASEEAGRVDPVGSFGATAGPDQVEAVVAFHQRSIDRSRKTWVVELDPEIFAIAIPRGLLPGGSELDGRACEDAKIGCLVVVFLGRDEFSLDVERERLDRSCVAVIRRGECTDGSHGGLPLLSGRANRSLDGGPWPGERSARSRQARSAAEDGGRRLFCSARNAATSRQGKKAGRRRCGKAIEA